MKNIVVTLILILSLLAVSSIGFAEENLWQQDFIQALQKAKAVSTDGGGGLGYTPSQEAALESAIKKAMEMKAPPCEAMKIAVDLKYDPYATIKNVFAYGGEVKLDQLCMCATESGISKQIIARAAADATSPLGTPVFPRDEIAQAQCIGLGYTTATAPPPYIPPIDPPPVSPESPNISSGPSPAPLKRPLPPS